MIHDATVFNAVQICAHRLVPEGQAWAVDGSVLELSPIPPRAFRAGAQLVYLNPKTLERLCELLWAEKRTLVSITYAELMVALGTLQGEQS